MNVATIYKTKFHKFQKSMPETFLESFTRAFFRSFSQVTFRVFNDLQVFNENPPVCFCLILVCLTFFFLQPIGAFLRRPPKPPTLLTFVILFSYKLGSHRQLTLRAFTIYATSHNASEFKQISHPKVLKIFNAQKSANGMKFRVSLENFMKFCIIFMFSC